MFHRHSAPVMSAFMLCVFLLGPSPSVGQSWVTVTPEETDEILANPGMGWETFHRTADDDRNLPSWIPSTVHYARWGWGTLEPSQGHIDYAFIDDVLKESREAQAAVSTALAEQVLGALHELLRGFHAAEPAVIGELARRMKAPRSQR